MNAIAGVAGGETRPEYMDFQGRWRMLNSGLDQLGRFAL